MTANDARAQVRAAIGARMERASLATKGVHDGR